MLLHMKLKPALLLCFYFFADQLPQKCYLDTVKPLPQQEPLSSHGYHPTDLTHSDSSVALWRPWGVGWHLLGYFILDRRRQWPHRGGRPDWCNQSPGEAAGLWWAAYRCTYKVLLVCIFFFFLEMCFVFFCFFFLSSLTCTWGGWWLVHAAWYIAPSLWGSTLGSLRL